MRLPGNVTTRHNYADPATVIGLEYLFAFLGSWIRTMVSALTRFDGRSLPGPLEEGVVAVTLMTHLAHSDY